MKKRILILLVAIVIISPLIISFCRFSDILVVGIGKKPYDLNAQIHRIMSITKLYPHSLWLKKGDFFEKIKMFEVTTGKEIEVSIKLRWNNTVDVTYNNSINTIVVDSVIICPETCLPDTVNFYFPCEDSLFTTIVLCNRKEKKYVRMYRQKSSMPYKGKRLGFRVMVDGHEYITGKKSPFDY